MKDTVFRMGGLQRLSRKVHKQPFKTFVIEQMTMKMMIWRGGYLGHYEGQYAAGVRFTESGMKKFQT